MKYVHIGMGEDAPTFKSMKKLYTARKMKILCYVAGVVKMNFCVFLLFYKVFTVTLRTDTLRSIENYFQICTKELAAMYIKAFVRVSLVTKKEGIGMLVSMSEFMELKLVWYVPNTKLHYRAAIYFI